MTKQADFKSRIRARMEKTGERYAAARHALLRQADASPSTLPTVPGYTFRQGYERDHSLLTTALAQATPPCSPSCAAPGSCRAPSSPARSPTPA